MDRFDAMKLFLRVAETGSFSKAASSVGIGQPAVSKQIAALEERLGAQLFRRTSRGLRLTSAGEEFYESTVRLLGDLETAEERIGRGELSPAGVVRVATSAGFGRMYVVPRLPVFFARYPELAVEFDVSERQVDLIEDGIDVAIRIGNLPDSGLVARRIGSASIATIATPAYLARRGTPKTPRDLESHDCVTFMSRGAPRSWVFKGPGHPIALEPKGRIRSNDAEYIRAAVLAGLGIGNNPSWLYARELKSGAVQALLEAYQLAPLPIHAVCAGGRGMPGRVRVFIDFLAELCTADPYLKIR